MIAPPYLAAEDGEFRLDVAVRSAGRERLALSDRATALLVDDLDYGNRDVVPWVTARTLALTGGAARRSEPTDAKTLGCAVAGADGGREATDAELEAVADYLRDVEVADDAVETLREHVRSTRLSTVLSPAAVRSDRERTQGLRDIANDL